MTAPYDQDADCTGYDLPDGTVRHDGVSCPMHGYQRPAFLGAPPLADFVAARGELGDLMDAKVKRLAEPDDGEALAPEGERIAEGVRAVQQDRHERFTTEAKRQRDGTLGMIEALVSLPSAGPGSSLNEAYRALTPAQQRDFDAELRRSSRVAKAKATQQYALAAILTIGVVVALVVGWSILTNGWRWWA